MIGFRAPTRLLLAFSCVLAVSRAALAQSENQPENTSVANERDPAAAEALFRAGRELLLESKYDEAFSKFEESYRLDPTAGALYNQAECRNKQGKSASAWALFQQAATLANIQGKPDQFELATSRANLLQADLSYIMVHAAEPVPGLEISRDGMLVGRAQLDLTLPIDPGRHTISARAPGYEPFEAAIVIGERSDRQNVVIPRLKEAPITTPQPPALVAAPKAAPAKTPCNVEPWILAGAGAASLVVGGITGVLAIRENHAMTNACPTRLDCSRDVVAAQGRRDFESNVSWVTIPVGLVAIGGAATWMALSRHAEQPRSSKHGLMHIDANASARDVGFTFVGAF